MTETDERPPSGAGPRVDPRRQFHYLDRLRRHHSDRYLAGVCGGLGRHFDIDPTIIRVLFAVTTLFAGAGLLLYVAIWLLVPEDGRDRAAINLHPDLTRALLVAAAVIGVLTLTGDAWGRFHGGWVLAVVAFVAVAVLVGRERRGATPASTASPAPTANAGPEATWRGDPEGARAPEDPGYGDGGGPGYPPPTPSWQPPVPPASTPRPQRTGMLLFFPTLALVAIGLGILGLVDRSHQVPVAGYPALALAITGAMLVVGAFRGRPGGLILIGLVCAIVLIAASVTGSFQSGQDIAVRPTSSAQVQDSYTITNGHLTLDLTRVSDPQVLAGRTIEVRAQVGRIEVLVPRGLNVDADASLRVAGQITLGNAVSGGVGGVHDNQSFATGPQGESPLVLDLRGRVGAITVEEE